MPSLLLAHSSLAVNRVISTSNVLKTLFVESMKDSIYGQVLQ